MLCAHLIGPHCHSNLWWTWPHYMWSTICHLAIAMWLTISPSFTIYSLLEHFCTIIILGTHWLMMKSTTLYVINHLDYFAILCDFFTCTLHLLMLCGHFLGACCLHDDQIPILVIGYIVDMKTCLVLSGWQMHVVHSQFGHWSRPLHDLADQAKRCYGLNHIIAIHACQSIICATQSQICPQKWWHLWLGSMNHFLLSHLSRKILSPCAASSWTLLKGFQSGEISPCQYPWMPFHTLICKSPFPPSLSRSCSLCNILILAAHYPRSMPAFFKNCKQIWLMVEMLPCHLILISGSSHLISPVVNAHVAAATAFNFRPNTTYTSLPNIPSPTIHNSITPFTQLESINELLQLLLHRQDNLKLLQENQQQMDTAAHAKITW